jgi:hypothetical protein
MNHPCAILVLTGVYQLNAKLESQNSVFSILQQFITIWFPMQSEQKYVKIQKAIYDN